jgi:membrane protein implicated in regulation of membrane protease activity
MTTARGTGAGWRYLVLQVPGWALVALVIVAVTLSFGVPWWVGALVLAVFIGKDLLLYPVMRATFERTPSPVRPIGARGVAVEPLRPTGLIRVGGELWTAHASVQTVETGRAVVVRGARGLTLLVDPAYGPRERSGE